MSTEDLLAGLATILLVVRPDDRSLVVRALARAEEADYPAAHVLLVDVSVGYWLSNLEPPADLYGVVDELAARHRALRGAIGRPHDFSAPSRYGHLRG